MDEVIETLLVGQTVVDMPVQWRGMRILFVVALAALLAGCSANQPYTSQDMTQVRGVYARLLPTYVGFEQAYKNGNTARILRLFHREQRTCKRVDAIDARDTIDPNINLFQASVTLDTMCNTIESAYAWWAKAHHRPYDINVLPDSAANLFVGNTLTLEKFPLQVRHPDVET